MFDIEANASCRLFVVFLTFVQFWYVISKKRYELVENLLTVFKKPIYQSVKTSNCFQPRGPAVSGFNQQLSYMLTTNRNKI